jgi:hypothetical protein
LPDTAAGEALRCPFCGLGHEAGAAAAPAAQTYRIDLRQTPSAGRAVRWIVAIVVLVTLAGLVPAIVGLYLGWRAVESALPATQVTPESRPSSPAARTLQQLKSLPAGYHALDVAAPAGGYGALDATAALPWALTVAQAWQDDVRIARIDVERMRPDGTVNVQDDSQAMVMYRFESPSRIAALREQARLSSNTEAPVGVWVRVKQGRPEVYSHASRAAQSRGDGSAPHPAALRLGELVARPGVRRALGDAPFFKAYMIHNAGEGWVWYFSTLDGQSVPRVRAADGAVWPYRR